MITTREAVADIPAAATIDLEHLSPQAGAALLGALGVQGRQDELEDASGAVQGHGLALTLLGNYLRKANGGDVRRIGEVELSQADQRQGGHARKLMERYERWLGEGPELSTLRLLGLFDRPAEADSLEALRAAPTIAGLTDSLVDLSEEEWNYAVSNLRDSGLVAKEESEIEQSLDAHPLVREYFAARLVAERPDAARKAHRRLYGHLKQSAPELPGNLQDMMPLYHSVAHGCKAGLWQDALDEVYFARIRRGNDDFSFRQLGSFGNDLAALSGFFERNWSLPTTEVTEADQAWVLGRVAFCLRALGRLHEAPDLIQADLRMRVAQEDWANAAITAVNLSELYVTLGDVSGAVRVAEQGMELADRSGEAFQRMIMRTTLADALHHSARPERALAAFREAEAMQAEQFEYPLLYSVRGFNYCDLLLEKATRSIGGVPFVEPGAGRPQIEAALSGCREVRRRAETVLEAYGDDPTMGTLNFALDHLTLGRTLLLAGQVSRVEGRMPEGEVLTQAEKHLDESVSLLRRAGTQHHLPRGLLARAALWRIRRELERGRQRESGKVHFERAKRNLDEVDQIAGRSGMLIWQIEAALERCRLLLALGDRDGARGKLDEAQALVKRTEKPYEPHVPNWDEWEPPEYFRVFKEGETVGYHRRNPEIAALEEALESGRELSS